MLLLRVPVLCWALLYLLLLFIPLLNAALDRAHAAGHLPRLLTSVH